MLERFVKQTKYTSQEDFIKNFKVEVSINICSANVKFWVKNFNLVVWLKVSSGDGGTKQGCKKRALN